MYEQTQLAISEAYNNDLLHHLGAVFLNFNSQKHELTDFKCFKSIGIYIIKKLRQEVYVLSIKDLDAIGFYTGWDLMEHHDQSAPYERCYKKIEQQYALITTDSDNLKLFLSKIINTYYDSTAASEAHSNICDKITQINEENAYQNFVNILNTLNSFYQIDHQLVSIKKRLQEFVENQQLMENDQKFAEKIKSHFEQYEKCLTNKTFQKNNFDVIAILLNQLLPTTIENQFTDLDIYDDLYDAFDSRYEEFCSGKIDNDKWPQNKQDLATCNKKIGHLKAWTTIIEFL